MREYDYIISRKRYGALRNILAVRGIILKLILTRSYCDRTRIIRRDIGTLRAFLLIANTRSNNLPMHPVILTLVPKRTHLGAHFATKYTLKSHLLGSEN